MQIKEAMKVLEELANRYPKFPDGRINYTGVSKSAVVTVFLKFKDEILLLKRSDKVGNYKGMWNAVSGYFDEIMSAEDIGRKELREETGITGGYRLSMGMPHEIHDAEINKTWLVFPLVAEFNEKPRIRLNWENTEDKWVNIKDLNKFDIMPYLGKTLEKALSPSSNKTVKW
jgi:ADP-ribose pyrophosphatase YjhB (NUDIX family)